MTIPRTSRLKSLLAVPAFVLLVSCAVGPNFKKPDPPDVHHYTAAPVKVTKSTKGVRGGESQRFVKDLDIPREWWTAFHSRPLNDLIERSLKNNPGIAAAQAALKVARENTLAQKGAFYPSVDASFSALREKSSSALSPVTSGPQLFFNLFTPQVSVSYVPDVFGLNRRTVESLKAQEDQQRYQLAATDITLSSNVASAAIQEASLRGQIEATRQLIDINTEMLGIVRERFLKGYANRLDVAAQEAQLAQVTATLPPLLKQLAEQRDVLAALSGSFPSQGPAETFTLSSLQLPGELPLSLPSRLVEQRPDVRQAEENMHSASALIGVAVANRLPSIPITANAGSTALSIGKLFTPGVQFWSIEETATQPIFHGGTLLHRERAARAAFQQAAEEYRGAVLTAFQNVADTLNALDQDANTLNAAAAAERSAKATLDLTRQQSQLGYANYLALLSAEQTYQQSLMNLVQAQANRYADTAALFQALGGGWWHQADGLE